MSYGCVIVGGCDMKNKQKSQIKNREAAKQNRFNQWSRKRENDLKAIGREKPLTYNLGELFILTHFEHP